MFVLFLNKRNPMLEPPADQRIAGFIGANRFENGARTTISAKHVRANKR